MNVKSDNGAVTSCGVHATCKKLAFNFTKNKNKKPALEGFIDSPINSTTA